MIQIVDTIFKNATIEVMILDILVSVTSLSLTVYIQVVGGFLSQ